MNLPITPSAAPQLPQSGSIGRRIDPILQEVYDLKAQLNREANYSVEKVLERIRGVRASAPS